MNRDHIIININNLRENRKKEDRECFILSSFIFSSLFIIYMIAKYGREDCPWLPF